MNFRAIVPFRQRKQRPPVSPGLALAGVAAGAAAVALLEPRGGARRRGLLVQKTIHAGKTARTFGQKAARDLANRSRGLLASARSSVRESGVSDEVLCERVRSRIGRLTSHAGAIEVSSRGGVIELRGPVLDHEAEQVVRGTRRVRGVHDVDDHLERHSQPGEVSALRGGAVRRPVPEMLQHSWSPGARLLAIVSGAGLAVGGLSARRPNARAMGMFGALLALRGATNVPLKRLFGIGARRRAVDLRKTIHVEAPREEVFAFFAAFENFPRFMAHVREVHRTGDGRWHWTVDGPGGASVEWDAEVSALTPNEVVAWKTVPGAAVASSGIARFEDEGNGTRLDLRLSYNAPAGAVGHAFAVLAGADPKRQMNDDLLRFKSLLERGKAEGVTREEVRPRE